MVTLLWQKDSHIQRFAGFSENYFYKKKSEIRAKSVGSDAIIALNFSKGLIRLYWLFHVGFAEIRFFKWCDEANQSKFLGFALAILKGFSEGLPLQ